MALGPGRRRRDRRIFNARRRSRWPAVLAVVVVLLAALIVVLAARSQEPGRVPRETGHRGSAAEIMPTATTRPARPRPIRRVRFGRGAASVTVAYRGELAAPRPTVVFLHGWGVGASHYAAWVDHLVRLGNTVVLPRYQTSPHARPDKVRAAALRGVRRALRKVTVSPGTLVLAGHSAGAALAADLAVVATRRPGVMPAPVAVFAAYPGRAILGYPGGIPELPLSALRPAVRLTVLAGADDRVVAQAPARAMVRSATRLPAAHRRYVLVRNHRVDDHFGPTRASQAARRAFWGRLDALILLARR